MNLKFRILLDLTLPAYRLILCCMADAKLTFIRKKLWPVLFKNDQSKACATYLNTAMLIPAAENSHELSQTEQSFIKFNNAIS